MPRSARHTSLETRTARPRLKIRRAPHFVKIAKGLRLGYYRGAGCGTWIGRRYRGAGVYDTIALGVADDTADADSIKILDYWQAQGEARRWAERQRLIEEGMVRAGPYTVADAIKDYLDEIRAEKKPDAVRNAEYTFNAFMLPELGPVLLEKITPDRLTKWRNKLAIAPKRVRSKMNASSHATRATPDDDDARRRRKATTNRILTMLKAALNRAFHAGRVASDSAWRKVKPFRKVDEATVRYLTADEARRLVNACAPDLQRMVRAALLTGCRYSELVRLIASDFDAASQTLRIRLSKGKARHVTMTDEAIDCFLGWTAALKPGQHIFLREDGKTWGKSHQKRPLEAASERARIEPYANFHVLRHTHGSHLAMNGAPMAVIAKQLGHADTRMTEKHYAHLAPSYVSETIRAKLPSFGIAEAPEVVQLEQISLGLNRRDSQRPANEGVSCP
jgi:integrase